LPRLWEKHTVHALYHNPPVTESKSQFSLADVRDFAAMQSIFRSFKPELVLHLAGITAVSHALALTEKDVHDINVKASGSLAALCAEHGAKMIYASTDLVYNGSAGGNLREDAPLNPLSLYASTKLEGEAAVQAACDDYLILRIALMYGFSKGKLKAFFQEAYNKIKNGEEVVLFRDQYRSSLLVNDGARMLTELTGLMENGRNIPHKFLNFGSGERTSRAELFLKFVRRAGLDEAAVVLKSFRELPNLPQVEDVSLDISRLLSCGVAPLSVDESIDVVVRELEKGF
jgi:dTDP-4-dehydrorhamnose reductase